MRELTLCEAVEGAQFRIWTPPLVASLNRTNQGLWQIKYEPFALMDLERDEVLRLAGLMHQAMIRAANVVRPANDGPMVA